MKAITYHRYGTPEEMAVTEVESPRLRDGTVLVRVEAVSLNRSDWEILTGSPLYVRLAGTGVRRPKNIRLGSDVAGVVEAVGDEVEDFSVGDEVLADTMWHGGRTFAEHVVIPTNAPMVTKPATVTWEQAASLPQAALLAMQGLRYKGEVAAGDQVLIVGGGGGGGSFAIQMAKAAGAIVTAVDNEHKQEFMREMGADHVIDYRRESYSRGRRFDRILDFAGARSLFINRRALKPGGVYAVVGAPMYRLLMIGLLGGLISRVTSRQSGILMAKPNNEDLTRVVDLVARGELEPALDVRDGLDSLPDLMLDLGEGRLCGKGVAKL